MMGRFLMGLAIAILPISASAESNEKFSDSNGVQIRDYDQGAEDIVRRLAHLDEIIEKMARRRTCSSPLHPDRSH